MQHLQLQNVVLLGHSLGGMIAPWQKVLGALVTEKARTNVLSIIRLEGFCIWLDSFHPKKTPYKHIKNHTFNQPEEHWLRLKVEALSAALQLVVPPLGVVLMSTSSRLSSRAREAWRSSAREAFERGDEVLAKIQLMVADSQLEKEMYKLSATDRSFFTLAFWYFAPSSESFKKVLFVGGFGSTCFFLSSKVHCLYWFCRETPTNRHHWELGRSCTNSCHVQSCMCLGGGAVVAGWHCTSVYILNWIMTKHY